MSFRINNRFGNDNSGSFNMTPIIDIVFLLILFFLVVCQFIEAENFPVAVPDDCNFARDDADGRAGAVTVTVMKTGEEKIDFAVGSEKVKASNRVDIAQTIAKLIDIALKKSTKDRKVVTLRIDKDICFYDARYALVGIAESAATDIKLAALKDERID